jgi:hypothetical protein
MALEDKKPHGKRHNRMKRKFSGGAKYYKGGRTGRIGEFVKRSADKIKGIDLNVGGPNIGLGGSEPPEIPWNPVGYDMQAEKGSMPLKKINRETGLDMMQTIDKYTDAANTIKNMEFKEETGYDSPEAMEKELEEYNANPMQNRTLNKFKGKYDQ